ncbi:MAG: nucleoside recognition domain-containing protein [Clostridia bacterium]
MLDFIWMAMIVSSVLYSILTGSVSQTSQELLQGGTTAVTITIGLVGAMAFWLGITELAVKCGITKKISTFLKPIIVFLFPEHKNNTLISEKITLNITANLLGLGNAATPLALDAMKEMQILNKNKDTPTKSMILFVLINTASLQILPTQIATLRLNYGSEEPFSVLIPIWLVSLCTLVFVIIVCKFIQRYL